ncbi:polysaccharide biosynthesis protein [Primorskyibacter sp. S187A]|uniref:polysaccharide biosynthesis protein n=1 Tax=Primorskyibacter sp. S187A TaxID=3415130 RepID=UPI003C7D6B40
MSRRQKSIVFLALDMLLIAISLLSINALLLGGASLRETFWPAVPYLSAMVPMAGFFTVLFGLHRVPLNYYERKAMLQTFIVAVMAGMAGLSVSVARGAGISVSFFVFVSMAFLLMSVTARLLLKEIVLAIYRNRRGAIRVLIYGAGRTGQQLAAALERDDEIRPVAYVDDNRALHGLTIYGLKVHSTHNLSERIEKSRIDRIVLAMPSVSESEKAAIAEGLSHLACEVHSLPSFASLVMNRAKIEKTEPLDFSKLLGRHHLEADLPGIRDMYRDKVVLVTGAGGSIGSEICLQVAASQPRCLLLLDHSEFALYQIERKLSARFPDVEKSAILGSVCSTNLVEHVFEGHAVDVVLHAAAYKQLPMLETNPIEGMRNNVLGTRVVAAAAMRHESESFILISTDKAVRPRSWLGYSKRFAEMLVQDMATRTSKTRMSMVRFGNVLGSSGSVIPLFQEQIARGGPVTLTHKDVTRYFMTVSEAVRLVLVAGSFARGGDVFVLDMGAPIPIRDLARNLVEASGLKVRDAANPQGDIELLITGLRDGEKLEEELLIGSDMLTTLHPKILRAQEVHPSEIEMATILQDIGRAIEAYHFEDLNVLSTKWARFLGNEEAPTPPVLPDSSRA